MRWEKLGQIFCGSGQSDLMVAGGRAPVPLHLSGDLYRIYFGSYDKEGRGRIFSLELDLKNPTSILDLVTEPIVDIGDIGFFDDNGVIPSDVIRVGNKIYLYTIGFSVKNRIIFDAASGLAISDDEGRTFAKLKGPVIDRGVDDPCFAASPTVMLGADGWRMWYVSCDYWKRHEGGYRHYYNIKHRRSKDGIYWDPHATVCIDYGNEYEYAISRPSVILSGVNRFRMWYSWREQKDVKTYRIGFAESQDGLKWQRVDSDVGIDISVTGWDSEMICYPRVFEHAGSLYMLYNGNGYGKTGFGLAILREGP
jgi:hypothetical protein